MHELADWRYWSDDWRWNPANQSATVITGTEWVLDESNRHVLVNRREVTSAFRARHLPILAARHIKRLGEDADA
jgi:hypothetical protein